MIADHREHGRDAASPWSIPWRGWREILIRTWAESGDDNVGLVAAGVAFYGFLALVPLLGATVLSYGLLAEPETVLRNMQGLAAVMPDEAAKLVGEQLMNVVQTSGSKKGLGLLLALGLALFGARNGAGSLITALNIAYEEKEKRSFVVVNLLALGITAASVAVAIFALIAVAALGHLETLVPLAPAGLLLLGKCTSYLLFTLASAAAAATLYRYGPSRRLAQWAWLTPGSLFSATGWLALTLGFGLYAAHFGNYNATYGSLGAVVVLLTWLYLSSYVLLFGAELNAELEHQTARDTTAGGTAPLGSRGAWVADHVAGQRSADSSLRSDAPPLDVEMLDRAPVLVSRAAGAAASGWRSDYVASRVMSRFSRTIGGRNVGMASSALATAGLGMVRRPGSVRKGTMLVAAAVLLALLSRDTSKLAGRDA